MEKVDLFKLHKSDYSQAKSPKLINIAQASYLTIDGNGAPGGENFEDAVSALYAMAYTIKMTRKKLGLGDYVICKLEARYWSTRDECLSEIDKNLWQWQLMIRTPPQVTQQDIGQAAKALSSKGKTPSVNAVEMTCHTFGDCIQMLHVGAYEDEHVTIIQMMELADEQKLTPSNEHCEVYISDPRRIPPERLKTILRMPIKSQ